MLGSVVDGKYRVERKLGQGGMGAVYEAVQVGTGRRVALKVILNESAAANKEVVVRFQREARAAGAIDTQHIVQILDTGTDPATAHPYMVMEYLAGEDVSEIVQRVGPLPPDVAVRIVGQAAIGLQRAHERGVIHRDIKPANLYLSRMDDGSILVKVLDFGIAKVAIDLITTAENAGLTRTGSMLGSPLYMSPEQAKSAKSLGQPTDIWSLGVVLYEALCGRSPNAHAESLGQLILSICSEPAAPIQDHAPWVQPQIARIVHKALQIDVARRFPSMAEMVDALRALCPNGFALQERELAALPEQARAQVAPRFVASENLPNVGAGTEVMPGAPTSRPSLPQMVPGASGSWTTQPATSPHASTLDVPGVHAISQNRPQSAPPTKSNAFGIALASFLVLGALGGGLGLYARKEMASRGHAERPTPSVDATPAPPPPASSSPVDERSFVGELTIEPPNADVEIDDKKATVEDGKVRVEGAGLHHVHLARGKRSVDIDVTVTDAGKAIPDRLTLGSSGVGGNSSGKKPPIASSAPAPAPTPSTKPKPPTAVDRGTDEFGK